MIIAIAAQIIWANRAYLQPASATASHSPVG